MTWCLFIVSVCTYFDSLWNAMVGYFKNGFVVTIHDIKLEEKKLSRVFFKSPLFRNVPNIDLRKYICM